MKHRRVEIEAESQRHGGEQSQSPWKITRLGDAVAIAQGQVDPRCEPYASMVHIGPENVQPAIGSLLQCKTSQELGLISGKYLFQQGDVVYSKIRPYLRKAVLATFTGVCSADMYPLRALSGFTPEFIHAVVLSDDFTRQAVAQQQRTGIPKVNRDQLTNITIPQPSISEQRLIGSLISQIREAWEYQQGIVSTLGELKRSTMESVFQKGLHCGSIFSPDHPQLPLGWTLCQLGDVITQAQYGLSIRGSASGRFPILRMNCQERGRVSFRDLQYVELDDRMFNAFKLESGDLLFNRTNSIDLVGRTAIYESERSAVFASYLIRLRVKRERMLPAFLNYYLNDDATQSSLKGLAGRGVSQANISASKLRCFPVPMPPTVSDQQRIVEMLRCIDDRIDIELQRIELLASLLSGVLEGLLTGTVSLSPLLDAKVDSIVSTDCEAST